MIRYEPSSAALQLPWHTHYSTFLTNLHEFPWNPIMTRQHRSECVHKVVFVSNLELKATWTTVKFVCTIKYGEPVLC